MGGELKSGFNHFCKSLEWMVFGKVILDNHIAAGNCQ